MFQLIYFHGRRDLAKKIHSSDSAFLNRFSSGQEYVRPFTIFILTALQPGTLIAVFTLTFQPMFFIFLRDLSKPRN